MVGAWAGVVALTRSFFFLDTAPGRSRGLSVRHKGWGRTRSVVPRAKRERGGPPAALSLSPQASANARVSSYM
ncbi:hypothetical protein PR002_g19869 [Phytophthora rubi]|uniref:Uncharacterized protein n=1 Tax=Phytophthora rubi TaxID=129364 RepID=A0A6A3JHN8_9STRA|nr:hypothetical protein PR002_g19869 [Phytophthora rubi]